jgi:hypothetical protein
MDTLQLYSVKAHGGFKDIGHWEQITIVFIGLCVLQSWCLKAPSKFKNNIGPWEANNDNYFNLCAM